ncbi:MAG: hypothetical protein ACI841_002368 [Planctomycetota bacterium]
MIVLLLKWHLQPDSHFFHLDAMNTTCKLRLGLILTAGIATTTGQALAQNTSQLSENGWYSDDTRADGLGAQPAGTNLISPQLTDDPEATAVGTVAHDADIQRQISFGAAAGTVPAGTHRGAVHMTIGATGSGKSQISDRKDDGLGHADGSDAFGPGMSMEYSWMGDGTISVTTSVKFGVKTADFGSTGVSSRTGENVWDKIMIYEPGNLNGGTSDGLWHTETVDYSTGKWWFFDRTVIAATIGTPMTLEDMSTSAVLVGVGPKTIADVYALITAPGAHITSAQSGVGSGNSGASVYLNQLETNFYRPGSTTTFGGRSLECDQNVTSNAIFGSGNDNGAFTTDRNAGVELGLRAKQRFPAANIFNSNGDGTYTFNPGAGGSGSPTPLWAFEWSANTDYDSSTGDDLDDLTYELGMDFDAGPGTNFLIFDPISIGSVIPFTPPTAPAPFWDHSIGDNSTAQGAGVEAGDAPTYAGLVAANNLAQNSWRMDFFDEFPFDVFDPEVEGSYEFYLSAYKGGLEVARTSITVLVESVIEFDQDVTSNAIFGSGNINGSFTTDRNESVEVGLRIKQRFPAANTFNSNGDGTYTFSAGVGGGTSFPNPEWGFEWSVNTDFDSLSGRKIGELTYEIGLDFDPGPGTDYLVFDPISMGSIIPYSPPSAPVPFWDHSIGDNGTAQGAGAEAIDVPSYAALIAANNLAQNSWRMTFFNTFPFDTFDPTVSGRYEIYLTAYDGNEELARTAITAVITESSTLALEAAACQNDQDCDLPGVQVEVDLTMRNLATGVTGFQSFLSFDDSAMTFEAAASSYSSSPFGIHIQGMGAAEVASGELRLDGTVAFGGAATNLDATLATLVFTVTDECTPVSLDFDLTQAFDSELSVLGAPIATALLSSGSIVSDNTPPILDPVSDITVSADAGVSGGCDSAVVNFSVPAAVDLCNAVSVECFPPSGTAFPAGQTTTVTCVATDTCGNTALRSFDVTVTNTNLVQVDIQLVGVTTATTRCIHFVADDCAEESDAALAFDASGFFSGLIEIPCGTWVQLCIKDEQHTLWDTVTLALSLDGTTYVGNTQADLEGGDTDNDGDVDINDVTLFVFQFGDLALSGGCGWDGTRDSDFSNDGAVGSEDYTFLTANWLSQSTCSCIDLAPNGDGRGWPIRPTSQPVTKSWHRKVDFDRNGKIDYRDIHAFEVKHGLAHELSKKLHDATPVSQR